MKTALFTISIILIGSLAWGQAIDENGRTDKQKTAQVKDMQPKPPVLSQKSNDGTSVVVAYYFPERNETGEIRLFHPIKDLELGVFQATGISGEVQVPKSSLVNGLGVVGLYSKGKLLETLRIKAQ